MTVADPWTIYWQADNQDSCIASASKTDAEQISRLWQKFAAGLANNSTILDLATGNGAVPLALLRGNPGLQITGVDLAQIDPVRFLSSTDLLESVTFVGGIDVCSMPFESGSFDAATSQFGIEYAPIEAALAEATRVVASGGSLNFLLHHADSEIVAPARTKLREMESLLSDGGVIDRLAGFVRGDVDMNELDAAGMMHLDGVAGRRADVTGQVFRGVNQVIQSVQQHDSEAALELVSSMTMRLRADRDRLTQLTNAALTESDVNSIGDALQQLRVEVHAMSPYCVQPGTDQEALLGWYLQCTKM